MAVVDSRQEMIRESTRIASWNSTQNLLEQCWYVFNGVIFPEFIWKNILSIGWGFWGVAPVLSDSARQIILVDPIFWEEKLDQYYTEDEQKILERIRLRENYFAANQHLTHIPADINEARIVLQEFYWWKQYDPKGIHRHIMRNSSYGEELKWIPDGSQDNIFINYVLLKETVQLEKFLWEANRVLWKNGEIILSDYEMPTHALQAIRLIFSYGENDIIQNDKNRFIVRLHKK